MEGIYCARYVQSSMANQRICMFTKNENIFFVGKLAALTRRTPNCFPKLYALLVLLLFTMQLVLRVLLERPQLLQHLHRKSKQPKWTIMIPDLETVRYHQSTPISCPVPPSSPYLTFRYSGWRLRFTSEFGISFLKFYCVADVLAVLLISSGLHHLENNTVEVPTSSSFSKDLVTTRTSVLTLMLITIQRNFFVLKGTINIFNHMLSCTIPFSIFIGDPKALIYVGIILEGTKIFNSCRSTLINEFLWHLVVILLFWVSF
jgi:hypothetical protein